ncbi:MAG: hypothetical protein ACRD4S_12395 [Candidatus Acidiferrales bacterium]
MPDVRVTLNEAPQLATIAFATNRDLGFIDVWRDKLGSDADPRRRDALDLAQLATDSFIAHSRVQLPYVNSEEEIASHIAKEPNGEFAGFIMLHCANFPDSKIIGVSHFRRTWCNNIVLDYLAAHPFAANPPDEYSHVLGGVGTVLLWFVCNLAQRHSCGCIWGEATYDSRTYYNYVLGLKDANDLILIHAPQYTEFAGKDLAWSPEGEATTMKTEAVTKLYEAEKANPPLIGRRSFVVSPSRTLAYHFVELAWHDQMAIAKSFGLPEKGDEKLEEELLFRKLFRRATESGKLADLWTAVERKHQKGRPDDNPFRQS